MATKSSIPVSVIECAPATLAEDLEAVGLTKSMLIRHCIEDAAALGMQPVDLLADRLGVSRNALWFAARGAGLLHLLASTADEIVSGDEATLFLAEHAPESQPLGDHDLLEASRLTEVETDALECLQRLTGELTPLVTRAEFQGGGGIDPQLSDSYQGWLSRVETFIVRKGLYPERGEKGYGEVPVTDLMADSLKPQCPVGYDGPSDIGFPEDDPINPWFWTMPVSVVKWPSGDDIASLDTVTEIAGDDALDGLWAEVSQAMRKDIGVLGWKVITRRPENHLAKAEAEVAGLHRLRDAARAETGPREGCNARDELTDWARELLGKAAGWQLWDSTEGGVPVVDGKHRPDLSLSHRMAHAIRRKASRKAHTRTALAWIDPSVLSENIVTAIDLTVPGKTAWAIQVWFDPYECGIAHVEAAATAPMTTRQKGATA